MKQTLYIILAGLLLSSCSTKTFDNKEELWNYLNNPENEYIHTKTVNGVDFSLIYKPTDLLVDQELSGETDDAKIDSLRSKYDQYLYFNLSMSKNNQELLSNVAGNKQRFGAMVNQLAFGMEQKVYLYTPKKDTIEMADYIYPRMYGMSGATTILLVYPKDSMVTNAEHMTLSIEDLGFYTGEVKFKIPTKIFKNEIQLKFE
ncbi:hypothetical protein [uncultured Aquimarina sp.]|uniref:hypothetical protein n=1 Tax=uncultured Aquimarina sp. TaxID=575652 RepID=UPI0026282741|nr:hypothetical protein [uncultured Aquimarina sp.]